MKLTKDDFQIHACTPDEWYMFIALKNPFKAIDQILQNQEDAEKWRLSRQADDSAILMKHSDIDKLKEDAEKYREYTKTTESNSIMQATLNLVKNHEIVERLKKRIEELQKLLENKDLTPEKSMELQYWLRENTMALGESELQNILEGDKND